MRNINLVAGVILVVSTVSSGHATNIWMSTSPLATNFGEVTEIDAPAGGSGGRLYIWARPDAGKTLQAWSLNLRSTDSTVVRLDRVAVENPSIDAPPSLTLPGLAVKRFQNVQDSESRGFVDHLTTASELKGFGAFSFGGNSPANGSLGVVGAGIGPASKAFDPKYDPARDSWLLAAVDYEAVGPGTAELYLQVGGAGILNAGETTGAHHVVFGDPSDPFLFGGYPGPGFGNDAAYRGVDSATPDAIIHVFDPGFVSATAAVPEPVSWQLAVAAISLAFMWSRRRPPSASLIAS